MAYYRRRSFKRTFRRRRRTAAPWYRKKYSPMEIAQKAARGVWYLKGLVNSEKFKHDISSSAQVLNAGALVNMVAISQGDGDGQRTGNSIFVRSLSMKGSIDHNPAGDIIQKVRVMLIIDKQQLGDTAPSASDVLDTTGTTNAPFSMLNDTTVGRFTILKSRLYTVTTERPVQLVNWNINMRHHVRYNGSASTDIQKGGIYLLTIGDVATNPPAMHRFIRVAYHDN